VAIEWEAGAVGQLNIAVLADVAVDVVVLVHGHHPNRLLCSFVWHDGRVAGRASGRIQFVIVGHAEDSIVHIHRKGHPVQTLVALLTSKTARMVGFAHGVQYGLHDEVTANGTSVRSLLEPAIEIVFLAINFAQNIVEGFASQGSSAGAAGETICMIEVAHRLTSIDHAQHLLPTMAADSKIISHGILFFHFLFNLFGESLDLLFGLTHATGLGRGDFVIE